MLQFVKRNLVLIIVIGIFVGLIGVWIYSSNRNSDGNNDITISEYSAVVTLNEDGTLDVQEQWNMNYSEGYSVRFRDFDYQRDAGLYPYSTSNISNPSFDTTSASVEVYRGTQEITNTLDIGYSFNDDRDELGNDVRCEPVRPLCESIFTGFFGGYGLEGRVTFAYEYKLDNVVLKQDGYLDLTHTLLGYAENEIEEGSITIYLPDNTFDDTDFEVFGHMENSTARVISSSWMLIEFEDVSLDDPISFRVTMPEDIIDNTNLQDVIGFPLEDMIEYEVGLYEDGMIQENRQRDFDIATYVVFAIFVLVAYIIKLYVFTNRGEKVDKDVFYPPTNLSPADVSYLMNKGKFKKEVITATLLDLCRRGYVEIVDANKQDDEVVFHIDHTLDISDLMGHEEALMKWLFGKDLTIDNVSSITLEARAKTATDKSEFYKSYMNFVRIVNYNGIKQKSRDPYMDRNKRRSYFLLIVPIFYLFVGLYISNIYEVSAFLSTTMSIVIGILYVVFIETRYKYSRKGYKTNILWKKYMKYVISAKSYDHVDMEDVNHLEELLVFATLFGKADKVMEQLTIDASNPRRTIQQRQLHSQIYLRPRTYYNYHRSYWYRPWHHTYNRRLPKPRVSRGFFGSLGGGFSSRGGGFSSGGGRSGGGRSGGGSRGGGGRSR